jgi:aspartate/tyrosine/aromatic aminotransferase
MTCSVQKKIIKKPKPRFYPLLSVLTMATIFDKVPQAPEDAVFGLSAQCTLDPSPNKINLVIGAYRDEDLKPWVLPVVRSAQTQLATDPNQNHEYLSIDGSPVCIYWKAKLRYLRFIPSHRLFFSNHVDDRTTGILPPRFEIDFGR